MRARLERAIAVALLLLGTGAFAEEEPVARAPLPPPLSPTVGASGTPQSQTEKHDPAPRRDQPVAGPPNTFDRSKAPASQKKPRFVAMAHRDKAATKGRDQPVQRKRPVADKVPRHRVLVSAVKRSSAVPEDGYLSPPNGYRRSELDNAAIERVEPPRIAVPYYRPLPGPPAYGYSPDYPYLWSPPGGKIYR